MSAQGEAAVWYFGQNAGLDFNSGAPIAITDGQLDTVEGCVTISNSSGDLLFYSDGNNVWDKNHNVMPNGTGLLGDPSSTQSGIIIPKPGNPNIYYIFTVDDVAGDNGLRYSEVDLSLNGGNGNVTLVKNESLFSPSTEKISAIQHSNGTDYWVVSHSWDSSEFLVYKITATGVNTTPVISSIGSGHTGDFSRSIGYMKVSPNGEKLALAIYGIGSLVEVFDFDNSSGVISNPTLINNYFYNDYGQGAYGLEFSSDSNLLYVSDVGSSDEPTKVHQFNLSAGGASGIIASDVVLYQGDDFISAIQLGVDGKIYLANWNVPFLDIIAFPNNVGASANYINRGVDLNGRKSMHGLPPFIQTFFNVGIMTENVCFGENTTFSVLSNDVIDSVLWDFGDGNFSSLEETTNYYSEPGEYLVSVTVTSGTEISYIEKQITVYSWPIINPVTNYIVWDEEPFDGVEDFDLNEMNQQILSNQISTCSVTYHLTLEDAEENLNPINDIYQNEYQSQEIFFRIRNQGNCYQIGSFFIEVINQPFTEMPEIWYYCENETVTVEADAGFEDYLWSTGDTTPAIVVGEAGEYTVTVPITSISDPTVSYDFTKTITVNEISEAVISHIEIMDSTANNYTITVLVEGLGNYEYSLNGISYQDNNVFEGLIPGEYTMYVRDKLGCAVVNEEIYLFYYPKFFTPNGDNANDFWQIKFPLSESDLEIKIFDRYGKFLTSLNPRSIGWDGTVNGQSLPDSDYWFVVKRPSNGKEYKGHFTLRR